MVEAQDAHDAESYAAQLATVIAQTLGRRS
jgi:hypothetical protein